MRFTPVPGILILVITLFFSTSNAQVLTRGPYMTMATPQSVTIQWRTDLPCNSRVKYGNNAGNLGSMSDQLNVVTDHTVTLNNLQPDTKYYYSVGNTTQVMQGDTQNYFKTNPIPSPMYDKPIRFWAMGDMGKQTPQQVQVRESFKKYVDTNFVNGWIMLGDNAYPNGTDPEYQFGFFNYYQNDITKHIVLWPCLGNHDYANNYTLRTTHQIPYLDIFKLPMNGQAGGVASNTGRYYSYNYGNIHFVNLDSYGLELVNGNYYGLADTAFSPQVQWLKADLAANNLPWVIVSFHHPPYCMVTHNSDIEMELVMLRQQLNPILEHFNVDLVLSGHCHSYQRTHFMRDHFGLSASFDTNTHVRQLTSGKYDTSANSCPYIKNNLLPSDSGVIYMVIGCGSAVPQAPFPGYPHKAMVYSNASENGSLLLHVEGNRLDATWISTDTNQVVKDKFTILKKANRKISIATFYPATLTLKAGWYEGPYNWGTGDTTREIQFQATKDTMITVSDLFNCVRDTFLILDSAVLLSTVETRHFEAKVFPNPVVSDIDLQLPAPGYYHVELLTETGQVVLDENFYSSDGRGSVQLPALVPGGNYVLRLKNDINHFFTDKITVKR